MGDIDDLACTGEGCLPLSVWACSMACLLCVQHIVQGIILPTRAHLGQCNVCACVVLDSSAVVCNTPTNTFHTAAAVPSCRPRQQQLRAMAAKAAVWKQQ
jgi:hypothetical protein